MLAVRLPSQMQQRGPSGQPLPDSLSPRRPLPPHLVEYARRDVHHLLDIADQLGQLLLQEGGGGTVVPADEGQLQHGQRAEVRDGLSSFCSTPASHTGAAREVAAGNRGLTMAAAGLATGAAGAAPSIEQHSGAVGTSLQQGRAQPSVVALCPAAQQALQLAIADCHSRLHRAVHRSQAVTLSLYQPAPPAAAVAGSAVTLTRRYIGGMLERHARLTPVQVRQLEAVSDCVHVLASWRDAAARSEDEGLQCLLPDGVLLALAEAAAASVAPDAGNMRGRHQGLNKQRLLDLLAELDSQQPAAAAAAQDAAASPEGAGEAVVFSTAGSSCGRFPLLLQQQAGQVAKLLSEAAAGQRPWVCSEVQELLHVAAAGGLHGGSGSNGGKPHKRRDPAAYRQRLAERFSCKSMVRCNSADANQMAYWVGLTTPPTQLEDRNGSTIILSVLANPGSDTVCFLCTHCCRCTKMQGCTARMENCSATPVRPASQRQWVVLEDVCSITAVQRSPECAIA